MNPNPTPSSAPEAPKRNLTKQALACLLVLFAGFVGLAALSSMKKPPHEAVIHERPIPVETMEVSLARTPVFITAYGQARSRITIPVASEIPGKVIHVHPGLKDGNLVNKGDLLFEIDSTDYDIVIRSGTERLEILQQIQTLAHQEFQRKKQLLESDGLSTRISVDKAEKAWLNASDAVNQLKQVIDTAQMNLERCRVTAPFNARVSKAVLDEGQYVSPGKPLFYLADDSTLEIQVSLDSREARQWLQFKKRQGHCPWFTGLKQVPCTVTWTDDPLNRPTEGTLERVIRYDEQTRTLLLSVSVRPVISDKQDFPLVAGMFCKVLIPGKSMDKVAKVPQWTVSMENTVYLAENERLKTVPVNLIRREGDTSFISGGLKDGDLLICTRLSNPLENCRLSLVDTTKNEEEK